MKLDKAVRNIKSNIIYFILNSIIAFLARKIFLMKLGSEVMGLNSLIISVLGFLNILELGISNAVIYSLYNPLKKNNFSKVSEVVKLYKYLYIVLALIIAIIGIILSVFFPYIAKSNINNVSIYFLLYLISVVASYLLTYKHIVPNADEKAYIITKASGNIKLIKSIIQIILLSLGANYMLWLIIEIVSNIYTYIYINKKLDKEYEFLKKESEKSVKEIFKNNISIIKDTKNLFVHKIGYIVVYQTDNIVLSIFTDLNVIAIYSNYLMVIRIIVSFAGQIFSAFIATIGKLVSDGDNDLSFSIWRGLYSIEFSVATFCSICTFMLINDFISVWIGSEYKSSTTVVAFIVLNMFVTMSRGTIDNFKYAYGIFDDIKAPIVESIINLVISVVLVNYIGLLGVILGTFVSNAIIVVLWRPYIIFKKGFKKDVFEYVKIYTSKIFNFILIFIVVDFINKYFISYLVIDGWIMFIIKMLIIASITLLLTIISIIFNKKEFKYIKSIIIKLKCENIE